MFSKLSGVAAATAVGVSTTIAGAQGAAVQWKASDGGNGHWYAFDPQSLPFPQAQAKALSLGGNLTTVTSTAESAFIHDRVAPSEFWIGGYRDQSGWHWVTGEPWSYEAWNCNHCHPSCQPDYGYENYAGAMCWDGSDLRWNNWDGSSPSVFEWSADCNNDGIVDYGQILDGTFVDADANNVPDCCERGTLCVEAKSPFQWRTQDGGNDHWYQAEFHGERISWATSDALARARGGHLATITSAAENETVGSALCGLPLLNVPGYRGVWLGLASSAGAWAWVTGEPFAYAAWAPNQPDGSSTFGSYGPCERMWGDESGDDAFNPVWLLTEWSADCDGDGEVDFGQVARGAAPDVNHNNVPDGCECLGDLNADGDVDGSDLGAMLAHWGPVTGFPASNAADIDGDHDVDGGDLGILLSSWGACTQ